MATFPEDAAVRSYDDDLAPIFRGYSLSTFAPIILIAFVIFFVIKIFFASFAESAYRPYTRSLALTAANLWDKRDQLDLSTPIRGRSLSSLGPLNEVLDDLAKAVKKYELESPSNASNRTQSKDRVE